MANFINSIILNEGIDLNQAPIANKEAVLLIKEYWETEGFGPKKTRAVWFSIDELETILNSVKKIDNGDGVRIFFGKYPERTVIEPPSPDYLHMNTLVFVPTISVADRHINFFNVEDLVEHPENAVAGKDAFNHGQLCPQKCN